MSKKLSENPTIKEWQDTVEVAPEGTKEFKLFESENGATKKIQYNPQNRLFRFLGLDPSEVINNYNSGWQERNKIIDELQRLLSQKDYFELLGFIHENEPYEE